MERLGDFPRRAAQIRVIAAGIFDKRERAVVLDLVADLEKIAATGNGSTALKPLPRVT